MLAEVLAIASLAAIVVLLLLIVFMFRAGVRSERRRAAFEAAKAVSDADAADLSNKMVHLKTEHIQLTGYIHKSVHDLRDSLNALSLKSHANHLEVMKEVGAITKLITEIRERELTQLAAAVAGR